MSLLDLNDDGRVNWHDVLIIAAVMMIIVAMAFCGWTTMGIMNGGRGEIAEEAISRMLDFSVSD